MSVLACNRSGCENIMCDRLSDKYGYICDDCYNELLSMPYTDIQAFMDGDKPATYISERWVDDIDHIFWREMS